MNARTKVALLVSTLGGTAAALPAQAANPVPPPASDAQATSEASSSALSTLMQIQAVTQFFPQPN